MPRVRITGMPLGSVATLATWQAACLSIAAIGWSAFRGLGALAAVVMFAPVVVALARLHAHAPTAPSTSDLVSSTLGSRTRTATGLVQFVAYVLMAAIPAAKFGALAGILVMDSADAPRVCGHRSQPPPCFWPGC